jgi:2-polyprenyl-6-methoxyphenol hydroxylase-like FAD-dependent oxidoreductase
MATLSKKVDALVVGAGPVGLLAALGLARSGLSVEIVDRAWRSTAQSYACGLHAGSVDLLASAGLEEPLLEAGVRIDTLGFYEGRERKAEVKLGNAGGRHPFVLVVPQDRLEELLEDALRELGVRVRWGHRLDRVHMETDFVTATIEKLALTSVGYPFARSEEMVQSSVDVEASYLVGADGSDSHVRQLLDIRVERLGSPWNYEVIEFDCLSPTIREVRINLNPGTADVYWPQQGSVCRWSLQIPGEESAEEDHPLKERRSIVLLDDEPDATAREQLATLLKTRAPWFDSGIREIDWRSSALFAPLVAAQFGRGRCWLAGDAGHQANPVGMQSMNVGLREALDLTTRIAGIVRQGTSPKTLEEYDASRRSEWRRLLGGGSSVVTLPTAGIWAKAQRQRLLAWMPGSGAELGAYLNQLGLALSEA